MIVIGGGAAGFFCAINAARENTSLKVTILEKSNKLLSKVKISGGGRCNVTHACFDINELIKKYPRGRNFLKKSFHWFNTNDTVKWFEERNVNLKTEDDGRMFPITDTSQTIIDCLLKEANKYGVEILMNAGIKSITKKDGRFIIETETLNYTCDYVCVACGGFPKASQFEWLTKLGHHIETPLPSLFTFNIPRHKITELMGITVQKATVKIAGTKLNETGPVLITHWGLSGPAVLKLSAFAAAELAAKNYNFTIIINWLPSFNETSLHQEWQALRSKFSTQKISNKNPFGLPNRLWIFFLSSCNIDENKRWGEINSMHQNKLIKTLTSYEMNVSGKTTFKEEFVTCGGIKTDEIDANTMESKIVSNLFFAGEIMNVDGITGGFNFQHAWTSGYIAAKTIAQKSS